MIRSFRQSDMELIMEIWLAGNLQAHSFIPESYWRSNWEEVRGQIPEAEICVWEEDGAVLGFIGLTDGYVAGLFTAEGHRSRGIGRRLLEHCREKHDCLTLRVYVRNRRAVDFYLDYLSANSAGLFLPTSIKSYLDGRMGQLEERLSSIAFRQAVEQDMVAGILADAYQFSSEDLRRRRAESVQNVRKTNGRISLEQRVRDAWEEDDEWQD